MSGCERYQEMLEEYIDGLLDERGEREFLDHLERCPSCSAELEAETVLVEQIASLRIEDPGSEFTVAVMERLFGGEAVSRSALRSIFDRLGTTLGRHPKLAWSSMVSIALVAAFVIPSLIRSGIVGLLETGTDTLTLLIGPLTRTAGFADRVFAVAGPLARALLLTMKAVFGFLLAIAGTQQFSFLVIASVSIVVTASVLLFFQARLAGRRFSDV